MSSPTILGAWQVHNGRFPKGSQAKNLEQTAIGGEPVDDQQRFPRTTEHDVSMRHEMPIRTTRL
jgi:hypothetical protein